MNKLILPMPAIITLVSMGTVSLWAQQSFAGEVSSPALTTLQPTATLTPTAATGSTQQTPVEEYDDFAPGLAVFALLFVLLMLAVLGAGIVITAALIGGLAFLILMGIISSSVLVGFIQRRPGPALSAFLTQLCAAIGTACGIIVVWILLFVTEWPLNFWLVTGIGAFSGLLGGALMGLPASLGLRWIYSRSMTTLQARRDRDATGGTR
ncbi:MAG: hypothetical protein JXB30_05785 [Anaerolineae bacterium]|nr:hypothetical protein [Anaerolineae bacterium]